MPAVLRRCPPSCHVASKAPVLGSKNWPRSYSSAVSTRNWLVGMEENRSSKKKPYTTSITHFRDTSASHFPALPHRLLQLWLYRRGTCGFRPGMAIRVRMRLSGGIAAGFQGLLCSCLFSPDHCSNQQSLRVTGKKNSSGPRIAFIFTGFLPKPSWPIVFLPNTTLPTHFPHQTLCPHPRMSLQLSYKQIYFSKF